MKVTPVAAFGYFASIVEVEDGEAWRPVVLNSTDGSYSKNGYTYLYEGAARYIFNGEEYKLRTPGWLTSEHYTDGAKAPGTLTYIPQGKTSWVCISVVENKGRLPIFLSHLELKAGNSAVFENGSNIFLCKGSVSANGTPFELPRRQIRVRDGEASLKALQDSYLLLFPKHDAHLP